MKYIIIPILKILYVAICIAMYPIVFTCEALLSLWHWDKKHIVDVLNWFNDDFIVEDYGKRCTGQEYWCYRTPLDFITGNKTKAIKEST